jgi:hypothetical protein
MENETMPEDTMNGSMEFIGCLFMLPFAITVIVCVYLVCTT